MPQLNVFLTEICKVMLLSLQTPRIFSSVSPISSPLQSVGNVWAAMFGCRNHLKR